jgi:hypothetical protein
MDVVPDLSIAVCARRKDKMAKDFLLENSPQTFPHNPALAVTSAVTHSFPEKNIS